MQMRLGWQSTDSSVSSLGPESGHTGQQCRDQRSRHERSRGQSLPLSSIRTMTVGFGFAPNLLTLPALSSGQALAGSDGEKTVVTAGGDLHPALRTLPPHRRRHDYGNDAPKEQVLKLSAKRATLWRQRMYCGGKGFCIRNLVGSPPPLTPSFCHQQTCSR
jgi:hypothetical protein